MAHGIATPAPTATSRDSREADTPPQCRTLQQPRTLRQAQRQLTTGKVNKLFPPPTVRRVCRPEVTMKGKPVNEGKKQERGVSYTTNCIVCASRGKRRPATVWSGWVLLLTDDVRKEVTAGYCRRHRDAGLPHQPHISRKHHCVGMWFPDFGASPRVPSSSRSKKRKASR